MYGKAEFVQPKQGPEVLEIQLESDARTQPVCSGCGQKGPGYDTLSVRRFEFVPLWGIAVFFLYAMRRVDCERCGVTVEKVPWAEGKSPVTKAYMWCLAAWAKRMSWQEVAGVFRCSWEKVFLSVEKAVEWGLAHRDLSGITIMAKMNKAIDEVRAQETKQMKAGGLEPVLRNSRWSLLKRPENLTPKQKVKLADLVRYNLKTVRSYLLKEDFQSFWEYRSVGWAVGFLDEWCARVLRSRLEPMKKVARMLQLTGSHRSLGSAAVEDTGSTTLYLPSAAHGSCRGADFRTRSPD